jgi:hypothetical protein
VITTEQKGASRLSPDGLLGLNPGNKSQEEDGDDHKVERSADRRRGGPVHCWPPDWLNSLEESRAANMVGKKEVPF